MKCKLFFMCLLLVICICFASCSKKVEVVEDIGDNCLKYEDLLFIDGIDFSKSEFRGVCIAGDNYVVASNDITLVAFDSDLNIISQLELSDKEVITNVSCTGDEIDVSWYRYGLGFSKEFGISKYSLDLNGFTKFDEITIDEDLDSEIQFAMLLDNGNYGVLLYNGAFHELNNKGKFVSKHRLASDIFSNPLVIDSKVYVLTYVENPGKIYLEEFEGSKSNKTEIDISDELDGYMLSLCESIDGESDLSIGINGNFYSYSEDGVTLVFDDYRVNYVFDSQRNDDGSIEILGDIRMFSDTSSLAAVNVSMGQSGTSEKLTIATLEEDDMLNDSVELFTLLNPDIEVEVISYIEDYDSSDLIEKKHQAYMDAMKDLALDFNTKSIDLLYLPYVYQMDLINQEMLADIPYNADDYDVWNNVTGAIYNQSSGKLIAPNFAIKGTTINLEYADEWDSTIESLDRFIDISEASDIPLMHNMDMSLTVDWICADAVDGIMDETNIKKVLEYYKDNYNYFINDIEVLIHTSELHSINDYKSCKDVYRGDIEFKGLLLGGKNPYIFVENAYSIVDREDINYSLINRYLDFLYSDKMGYVSLNNNKIPVNTTYDYVSEIESQEAVSGVQMHNEDLNGVDNLYRYSGSAHKIEDIIDEYHELIASLDEVYYVDWYVESMIYDEIDSLTGVNGKSIDDVVSELCGRLEIYFGEKE